MWKAVLLVSFASVVLQQAAAQGGAESLPFHGFLPSDHVRELGPEGDDQPNDIYAHIPLRRPKLEDDEVVIYPHHFDFELGQDPEHRIYEVHSAKELAALSKHKHGKHGKHAHDHDNDHGHDHHEHHDKASKDSSSSKGESKTLKSVPAPTSNEIPPPHPESNHVSPPPSPPRPFGAYPPPPPSGAYPPPPPPGAYPPPPPPHARPPYPYRPNPGFPPRLPHHG